MANVPKRANDSSPIVSPRSPNLMKEMNKMEMPSGPSKAFIQAVAKQNLEKKLETDDRILENRNLGGLEGKDGEKDKEIKPDLKNYSKKDLMKLLMFMEAELQARDITLAVAKTEKAKATIYKHTPNNETAKVLNNLMIDEDFVKPSSSEDGMITLFETPVRNLRRFAGEQIDAKKKMSQQLLDAEDRHTRQIYELEEKLIEITKPKIDSEKNLQKTLEEHIKALKLEANRKQDEINRLESELIKREKATEADKDRSKVIILYMLHERKQLLAQLHQMQMRIKAAGPNADDHETALVAELRKQIAQACDERNHLSRLCNEQQSEKALLVNIVRGLEEEINQLKDHKNPNMVSPTRTSPPDHGHGFVVANKAALANDSEYSPQNPGSAHNNFGTVIRRTSPTKYRIHNSATFPSPSTQLGPPGAPVGVNKNGGNVNGTRYNGIPIPHSSSALPRPSMGVRTVPLPSTPVSARQPLSQRQSRPTMGVAVQDYANSNVMGPTISSTVISEQKPSGIMQRLMRRSTSLPKKINGDGQDVNEQIRLQQQIISNPHISGHGTIRKMPLTAPQTVQQQQQAQIQAVQGQSGVQRFQQPLQRPPQRVYSNTNAKPAHTHIS